MVESWTARVNGREGKDTMWVILGEGTGYKKENGRLQNLPDVDPDPFVQLQAFLGPTFAVT